jgi:hypothetical protein
MFTKISALAAKTTPYPSCHRDYFLPKVPGQLPGWLRRVTLTNSTGGPLALIFHTMKLKVVLIICLISLSCNENQLKISSIDYLDFNWSGYDAKTDQTFVPTFFKCRIYARIDKSGETTIFRYNNQNPPSLYYYQGQTDIILIQKIESYSVKADMQEIDSLYSRFLTPNGFPSAHSQGTFLKMKVTFENNTSKLFHFANDEYSFNRCPHLLELQKHVYSLIAKNDTLISHKEDFDKIKTAFLKEALLSDTSFNVPFSIPLRILINDTIVNLNDLKNN